MYEEMQTAGKIRERNQNIAPAKIELFIDTPKGEQC
jgi:hypothetical protein